MTSGASPSFGSSGLLRVPGLVSANFEDSIDSESQGTSEEDFSTVLVLKVEPFSWSEEDTLKGKRHRGLAVDGGG